MTVAEQTVSINTLIREARTLRDEKDVLNRQLKEVNKQQKVIDGRILHYLTDEDLDKISAEGCTAIRSKKEIANVTDWDAFYEYVGTHNAFHLMQRRISSNAAVEMIDADEELPGVEKQTFEDLGFRRS